MLDSEFFLRGKPVDVDEMGDDWATTISLAKAGFATEDMETLKAARDRFTQLTGSEKIANDMILNRALSLRVEKHEERIASLVKEV